MLELVLRDDFYAAIDENERVTALLLVIAILVSGMSEHSTYYSPFAL
jgi:hypothetical protein